MGGADGNGSFPVLSITDRLRNIRDFLHVEDYDTHPRFKERLDDFDKFISNLASSKEMFDVRVYHDVKAMLSVARDRVLDQERDEAMKVTTYKVPSWSSTESSKPSDRDRVFSPNSTRRKSDETDATSHHSDERERGDPGRMVDDYGDGDCLEWAPHLLKQARENRRPLANQERFTRGKQPSTETIESETTNKRMKRTKWGIDDFVWPERRLLNGKSPSPLDEQEHSWDKEHERSSGVVELDEEEEIDRESDTGLVRSIPKLGSGSLIPPEIADFSANDEEPVASANRARAERRAPNPDERFYPGDPVFMFGETKYLQALQSRQIEKDLAPRGLSPDSCHFRDLALTLRYTEDAETQTAIDRKPLMGMFARFQLPKIYEEPVAKKSSMPILQ